MAITDAAGNLCEGIAQHNRRSPGPQGCVASRRSRNTSSPRTRSCLGGLMATQTRGWRSAYTQLGVLTGERLSSWRRRQPRRLRWVLWITTYGLRSPRPAMGMSMPSQSQPS